MEDLTEAELLKVAQDYDRGIENDDGARQEAPTGSDAGDQETGQEDGSPEVEASKADATKDSGKPIDDKASKAKETKPQDAKPDDKQQSRFAKERDRKDRTWAEINSEKEKFKAEREQFQRERQEYEANAKKAQAETMAKYRDDKGYTADDYEQAASLLKSEGEEALAKQAQEKAQAVRKAGEEHNQRQAQEQFASKWTENFNRLAERHDWLKDQNSDNYKAAVDLLNRYPILRATPEGINHAVELLELQGKASRTDTVEKELESLRKEVESLRRKTSIGPGRPTTPLKSGEKDFNSLSMKEQEAQLRKLAEEFDRNGGG